ncbi:hypothetical protein P280DRAFT_479481 [Massarina eburnea CBS 473.64]|uniref:Uncharacterized protein n=1 Tax=Massarina eburnea CBS 473.64 TaxID=1395130 RepID=A0A6A6S2Y4_9PLEO|nr:hypothetical protein P280DRAFT_479481 [Massarina eburnea CBS 473.64]
MPLQSPIASFNIRDKRILLNRPGISAASISQDVNMENRILKKLLVEQKRSNLPEDEKTRAVSLVEAEIFQKIYTQNRPSQEDPCRPGQSLGRFNELDVGSSLHGYRGEDKAAMQKFKANIKREILPGTLGLDRLAVGRFILVKKDVTNALRGKMHG